MKRLIALALIVGLIFPIPSKGPRCKDILTKGGYITVCTGKHR